MAGTITNWLRVKTIVCTGKISAHGIQGKSPEQPELTVAQFNPKWKVFYFMPLLSILIIRMGLCLIFITIWHMLVQLYATGGCLIFLSYYYECYKKIM